MKPLAFKFWIMGLLLKVPPYLLHPAAAKAFVPVGFLNFNLSLFRLCVM